MSKEGSQTLKMPLEALSPKVSNFKVEYANIDITFS